MPQDGSRAPAHPDIRWPAGIIPDEDMCVVGLEVIVGEIVGRELTLAQRVPWAGWGAGVPTLHALVGEAFASPAREILRGELAGLGAIDPGHPLRLERRVAFPQLRVFLDAVILPVGAAEAAELSAIMRAAHGSYARHDAGLAYAHQLHRRWADCFEPQLLPRVDLRQALITVGAPPTREDLASAADDPVAALV